MVSRNIALPSPASRSVMTEVQVCRGPTPNGRIDMSTWVPASSTSGSGSPSGPVTRSTRRFMKSGVSASSPEILEWNVQTSSNGAATRV